MDGDPLKTFENTRTFGSLYTDLQWGHSSFGGVHCERLRNVGPDIVAQAWTLALHLGAVHRVTDWHREWTTCTGKRSEELEKCLLQCPSSLASRDF